MTSNNLIYQTRKKAISSTAKKLARNRGRVLSLYCQILRCMNSQTPHELSSEIGQESRGKSLHNIEDLIYTGEYALSLLNTADGYQTYLMLWYTWFASF
ncbi:hypothetical protein MKX03_001611 [Papaver bracteatum]|nr:hypothetical protein MKX03_001611 [Papaver bracteatum]